MCLKPELFVSGGHIPECDGAVVAGRGECPFVGRKGQAVDLRLARCDRTAAARTCQHRRSESSHLCPRKPADGCRGRNTRSRERSLGLEQLAGLQGDLLPQVVPLEAAQVFFAGGWNVPGEQLVHSCHVTALPSLPGEADVGRIKEPPRMLGRICCLLMGNGFTFQPLVGETSGPCSPRWPARWRRTCQRSEPDTTAAAVRSAALCRRTNLLSR